MDVSTRAERSIREASDLRNELDGYIRSLRLEKDIRERLTGFMKELQGANPKSIPLDGANLAEHFPGARNVTLIKGETIVVVNSKGLHEEHPISGLDPAQYVDVMKCALSSVIKMVNEEEEARRVERVRPSLSVAARLFGGKITIFDWRSYRLVVSNQGGTALNIGVFVSTDRKSYGPFELRTGQSHQVELRHFRSLQRAGRLQLRVRCEDEEGRVYVGSTELKPNSAGTVSITLSPPKGAGDC